MALDGYRIGLLHCDSPLCAAVEDGLRGEGAAVLRVALPPGATTLSGARAAFAALGRVEAMVFTQPAGWADGGGGAPADGVAALDDLYATHRAIGEIFARQGTGQLVHLVTDQAYGDPDRPDLASYHAAHLSLARSLSLEWADFLHGVNTVVLERPMDVRGRYSAASTTVGLLDLSVTGQVISVSGARGIGRVGV